MILFSAIVLAVLVLPSPWNLVAVIVGAVLEVGEAWLWWRWSQRRHPATGLQTMIGRRGTVTTACRPRGQVRVRGEFWTAVCDEGADPGDEVEVVGVDADGLALHVALAAR